MSNGAPTLSLVMMLLLCPTLLGQTVSSPIVAQVPPLPPRLPSGIPAFRGPGAVACSRPGAVLVR